MRDPLNERSLAMCFKSFAIAALIMSGGAVVAQDADAPLITESPGFGSYDPQLTAREAVLANWDLAVSGIRAGGYVSGRVAVAADAKRVNATTLQRQAQAAVETMIVRYNSAHWLVVREDGIRPVDGALILAALNSTASDCAGDCAAHFEAIGTAFAQAGAAFDEAALAALEVADDRAEQPELVLLTELLVVIADYLDSPAWTQDLILTDLGRGGEEVSARLVGLLALWGNIEPYVGMRSTEIDDAINTRKDRLLRDLRSVVRMDTFDTEASEIEALRISAGDLAEEFRRAAELFVG